jgi:hypothetical protein
MVVDMSCNSHKPCREFRKINNGATFYFLIFSALRWIILDAWSPFFSFIPELPIIVQLRLETIVVIINDL